METKKFLQRALGNDGYYCVFAAKDGRKKQKFYDSLDAVVSATTNFDSEGWDAYFAPKFMPHAMKSRIMQNHYDHRQNIPPEVLWSKVDGVTEPAVVHGVKDFSAERQVKEKLGI